MRRLDGYSDGTEGAYNAAGSWERATRGANRMDEPISRGEFVEALEATYGPGDWSAALAAAKQIIKERGTLTAQEIHDTFKAAGIDAPPVEVLAANMEAVPSDALPGLRRDFQRGIQHRVRASRSARRN